MKGSVREKCSAVCVVEKEQLSMQMFNCVEKKRRLSQPAKLLKNNNLKLIRKDDIYARTPPEHFTLK